MTLPSCTRIVHPPPPHPSYGTCVRCRSRFAPSALTLVPLDRSPFTGADTGWDYWCERPGRWVPMLAATFCDDCLDKQRG